MRRRDFIKGIVGSAVTAWPFAGRAQQAAKMRVIGFLSPGSEASFISDFFDALAELGWSEGKNVVVERRNAENRVERLPELAAELVHLNVDVIVASGTLGPLAAKRVTSTIPIVMTASGDRWGVGSSPVSRDPAAT
jgi:putative tryptophan/tyrosine transport system substrate-binding protein